MSVWLWDFSCESGSYEIKPKFACSAMEINTGCRSVKISLYSAILLRGGSAFIGWSWKQTLYIFFWIAVSTWQLRRRIGVYMLVWLEGVECIHHTLLPISFIAHEQTPGFQMCRIRKVLALVCAIKFKYLYVCDSLIDKVFTDCWSTFLFAVSLATRSIY